MSTLLHEALLTGLPQVYRGAHVWTTLAFTGCLKDLWYAVSQREMFVLGKQHDEAGKRQDLESESLTQVPL